MNTVKNDMIFITPFMRFPPREFVDISRDEKSFLTDKREYHSSGRAALFSLAKKDGDRKPRLFVPRAFCPKICRALLDFFEIKYFDDLPSEKIPRFETLESAEDGDSILAVNYFGLRRTTAWKAWDSFAESKPGVRIIEDHSHAPFCDRFSISKTAFASLRKALPLPDGAISKSAKIRPMYQKPAGEMRAFASDALSAQSIARFDAMRNYSEELFYSAEAKLNAEKCDSRISAYSMRILPKLLTNKMADKKLENLKFFREITCENLGRNGVEEINFKYDFPANSRDIFFPILRFPDTVSRNRTYAYLAERGAFCSIYWGALLKAQATPITLAEIGRMFAIPLDFRHSERDVEILAQLIKESFK